MKAANLRALIRLFLALAIAAVPLRQGLAQAPIEALPADGPPPKAIATVLGKALTQADICVDKTDKSELRDFRAIAGPILGRLMDKYVKDHKLAATREEIDEFNAFAERKNRTSVWSNSEEDRKARGELAKAWIDRWKFNRSLYEKYGGRVIFQQAGLEPLDAYQEWLEDEERAGNFSIEDPRWRVAFWEYYKPKYHRFDKLPDPFKAPFWSTPQEDANKAASPAGDSK